MKLNEKDKLEIKKLQKNFVDASVERSQNNPADFDTNITCLKKYEAMTESLLAILKPYIKQLEHSPVQIVNIFNEAYAVLLGDGASDKIAATFHSEPRIIKLYANVGLSAKHSVGLFHGPAEHKMEYTITFSDSTELKLHSLDLASLEQARIQFESKMQALSYQAPRLVS